MPFVGLPASAAWHHHDARNGFETVFLAPDGSGFRIDGHTAAVEGGEAWAVRYEIVLDAHWRTRAAHMWSWSVDGERELRVQADGSSSWRVDGSPRPDLDGCPDVDLEASACTNTLPVHRLGLDLGGRAHAPAAYVRAPGLAVQRLEQEYARLDDGVTGPRYDYRCVAFGTRCVLELDTAGLVLECPGLATRVL